MGFFSNFRDTILRLNKPTKLGEEISLTHRERYYNDKQKAYLLKEKKLKEAIRIYSGYIGKTKYYIKHITNIVNYLKSDDEEPPQNGKDISLYFEKLKRINELFAVVTKGIPINTSTTLGEVDIIVGITKSTEINAQLAEANNHIKKIEESLNNTIKLTKEKFNEFDYVGWKKTLIGELSLILSKLRVVKSKSTSNVEYLSRIINNM